MFFLADQTGKGGGRGKDGRTNMVERAYHSKIKKIKIKKKANKSTQYGSGQSRGLSVWVSGRGGTDSSIPFLTF